MKHKIKDNFSTNTVYAKQCLFLLPAGQGQEMELLV